MLHVSAIALLDITGRYPSPETPAGVVRLPATFTADDLPGKSIGAIVVVEVKAGSLVEIGNLEFPFLIAVLVTEILGLSRRKPALESPLIAIVASASSPSVENCIALVGPFLSVGVAAS